MRSGGASIAPMAICRSRWAIQSAGTGAPGSRLVSRHVAFVWTIRPSASDSTKASSSASTASRSRFSARAAARRASLASVTSEDTPR